MRQLGWCAHGIVVKVMMAPTVAPIVGGHDAGRKAAWAEELAADEGWTDNAAIDTVEDEVDVV